MQAHFQRAILPVTVTAALFGFGIIEYPVGKPRRLLSLVYGNILCCLQLITMAIKMIFFETQDTIFINGVTRFLMFNNCFSILLGFFYTQWEGKRYCQCLDALNHVDETLRELGFQINYIKMRRVVALTVVTWVAWCFLLSITDLLSLPEIYDHFAIVIIVAVAHLPTVINIHFLCVLGYAGARFDYINSALRGLAGEDTDSLGWFRDSRTEFVGQKIISDEKNRRTIWTMMQLHFQLSGILREINRAFEMTILMDLNFGFFYVLTSAIFTFRVVLLPFEGNALIYCAMIWIWTVLPVLKIILVNHICETISNKAFDVAESALKLLRVMDDEKMREDVSLIVLQTKRNPLRFSGMGLLYYGHPLLQEISCSIVTMVVIILQMKTGIET